MSSKHTAAHVQRHASSRERSRAALDGIETSDVTSLCGTPTYRLAREHTLAALEALKQAGYDTVSFVTAVDRLSVADGRARGARFTLVHQLQAIATAEVVRLHTPLEEDDANAPTATGLWPGANYMEREVYDMFGIRFDGHPYMQRLLMPEDYTYYPLRKEFPHQGIEPDRLYREWDAARRANDRQVTPEEQTPSN